MESFYHCDIQMSTLDVPGKDKGGNYNQVRFECQRCSHIFWGEKLYVPGTAPRGNKEAHKKNNGRRGPKVKETA